MKSAIVSAISWCNSDEDELQNLEQSSAEAMQLFKQTFEENCARMVAGQAPRIECYAQSMYRLCIESRRQKRPVMLLVTRNQDDECFQ